MLQISIECPILALCVPLGLWDAHTWVMHSINDKNVLTLSSLYVSGLADTYQFNVMI